MARTKAAANASETGFDFANVAVTASVMPKITKAEKPNPLLPVFRQSLESDTALMFPVPSEEAAKEAEKILRHARALHVKHTKQDVSVAVRREERSDGTWEVHFHAKPGVRERKYSVADVRAWAEGKYENALLHPRVDKRVIADYRAEMGIPVRGAKES